MQRLRKFLIAALMLFPLGAAAQTSYNEAEPNDIFPPAFLPGNPVFQNGDRLVGSITAEDTDQQYLTVQGAGAPGIYRYMFDLNPTQISNGTGDSLLTLFDTNPAGRTLGFNDDYPGKGGASRVYFDHFDTSGANTVFGVGIEGYDFSQEFDYALSVSRTATPVTALGSFGLRSATTAGSFTSGQGDWYSFTLPFQSLVTLDTLGSAVDDTEMALFDSSGNTIGGNDDIDANIHQSKISQLLNAGTYYVTVGTQGSFFNDPQTWDRNGFSGGVGDGDYLLNIASAPTVPEPNTLLLFAGVSLPGLLLLRRRQQA